MLAIYKKELRSYFVNAIGYVYIAVFLAVSAFACCMTTIAVGENSTATCDTSSYFQIMLFAFIVLLPLLTMKLFSEEKKMRTEQLLLTAPVSLTGMVLAKFLAALTMFLGSMLVSCINFIPLYKYGKTYDWAGVVDGTKVNTPGIVGSMIGVVLVGMAFLAIGVFISALTENQLVAAVATIASIAGLLVLGFINEYIGNYALRAVISWISIFSRFQSFSYGIFDFAALLYYLSICAVFLFLTVRVYERRRWNS